MDGGADVDGGGGGGGAAEAVHRAPWHRSGGGRGGGGSLSLSAMQQGILFHCLMHTTSSSSSSSVAMTSMYVQQSVFRLTASCTCRASGVPGRPSSPSTLLRSYADADFLARGQTRTRHHRQRKHCRAPYGDGKQREWSSADDLIDEERRSGGINIGSLGPMLSMDADTPDTTTPFRRRCCDCD